MVSVDYFESANNKVYMVTIGSLFDINRIIFTKS